MEAWTLSRSCSGDRVDCEGAPLYRVTHGDLCNVLDCEGLSAKLTAAQKSFLL